MGEIIMSIIIKQVDCTNEDFLNYYLTEADLKLHPGLYPTNGFPAGFIAIDEKTNKVLGAGFVVDEEMHNQIPSYNKKDNDTNPWMMALHTSEEHRNQGIGKQIVDSMIEYCNELNFSQLNANTETAMGFYEKHWQTNVVSSYKMISEKNEELLTNAFRIDIKENLQINNKPANKKMKIR